MEVGILGALADASRNSATLWSHCPKLECVIGWLRKNDDIFLTPKKNTSLYGLQTKSRVDESHRPISHGAPACVTSSIYQFALTSRTHRFAPHLSHIGILYYISYNSETFSFNHWNLMLEMKRNFFFNLKKSQSKPMNWYYEFPY